MLLLDILFQAGLLKNLAVVSRTVLVGFLGGLTTFSSFGYEMLKLIEDARFQLTGV